MPSCNFQIIESIPKTKAYRVLNVIVYVFIFLLLIAFAGYLVVEIPLFEQYPYVNLLIGVVIYMVLEKKLNRAYHRRMYRYRKVGVLELSLEGVSVQGSDRFSYSWQDLDRLYYVRKRPSAKHGEEGLPLSYALHFVDLHQNVRVIEVLTLPVSNNLIVNVQVSLLPILEHLRTLNYKIYQTIRSGE